MAHPTKIATCCHCGSKAALTLENGRHELSCASCGAPLRNFKMLPKEPATPSAPKAAISHRAPLRQFPQAAKSEARKKIKPRKIKKRKGWLKGLAEEVFDIVEDIFD
ncbi:hypothetical protein Z946_2920 [Sulfitobacter noctilucicola]|uniref:TFIIB zinc-binding n=1 Tax=Sulfitobacter noctilucicola TaxID=1342301 RepID=A0A7W6MAB4_9RHOB|nr:hypothetical protein [Sulfitobacter noctilucicola]KIN64035.1 hypothetical protein Z946_2920 [Sulfitobacter noctilucicola]MBB4175391.1 hypothetical protein [Sulfitobacter noctilucicola]